MRRWLISMAAYRLKTCLESTAHKASDGQSLAGKKRGVVEVQVTVAPVIHAAGKLLDRVRCSCLTNCALAMMTPGKAKHTKSASTSAHVCPHQKKYGTKK